MTTSRIAAPARTHALPPPHSAHRAYFPALDGIRAVAFLLVFASHYFLLPWGWAGVNVFFVLSGFLITGILYDTRNQPHHVANFYVRRTLRIFPLYYGVMLLLVLLYPVFRWQWNWHWLLWPAYLGNMLRAVPPRGADFALLEFGQPLSRTFPSVQLAFGHFWSLCIEEQFYLVWPWFVFGIGSRRTLIRICTAAIVVVPLLRLAGSHLLPQASLNAAALLTVTPFPFDALFFGALLALLLSGPRAAATLSAARIGFAALAIIFLVCLAVDPAVRHVTALPYAGGSAFIFGVSLIDLFSACLIVMAMESRSLVFRLFNLRPLRWLGRISYGAYIFHDILHNQFVSVAGHLPRYFAAHPRETAAALAFAFTLVAAWASFRWFESPILSLKNRWTRTAPAYPEPIAQPSVPELIQHVA